MKSKALDDIKVLTAEIQHLEDREKLNKEYTKLSLTPQITLGNNSY